MATRNDALLLSLDAYNNTAQARAGWQRYNQVSDRDSGLFAAAYVRNGEIVVAFRGWDDLDRPDIPNLVSAYDGDPFEQIADAQAFLDEIRAANPAAQISLAGHSLGGGLAAILAVRNGLNAQTFGAIETIGAARESMNGYEFDVLGVELWEIPPAAQNRNITTGQLANYPDVVNHLIYGDVATYNEKTVPLFAQIGRDFVHAAAIRNGQLTDDSRFGRYENVYGEAFENLLGNNTGTPYSTAFETQLHALGFIALELVFKATLDPLWTTLPRLAFQLTNDLLGSDAKGSGNLQVTYDFLDAAMLDHLNAPNRPSVASAMVEDFQDLAGAGPLGIARASADINTAFLQLAIEYASVQTLGANPDGRRGGLIVDGGDQIAANLGSGWGTSFAPEGARLIRAYADNLLGNGINGAAAFAQTLFADANHNAGTMIAGSAANDLIFGGFGEDRLSGRNGADVIIGFGNTDLITGGAGLDILSGGAGNDAIAGGAGNDTIIGGAGSDRLNGGPGNDTFVFDSLAGVDRIAAFSVADDRMVFQNAVFDAIGDEGRLAAGQFRVGGAAGDADDRIIYHSASGALFFDSDGTAAAAQIRVAILAPGLGLTVADFAVI